MQLYAMPLGTSLVGPAITNKYSLALHEGATVEMWRKAYQSAWSKLENPKIEAMPTMVG